MVTVYFSSLKLIYPRRGALFRAGSKKGKRVSVGDVQTTSQRILACFVAKEFQGGIGVCPVAPSQHPASTWPPRPRPKTGKGSGETAGVTSGACRSGLWHIFMGTFSPSSFAMTAFLDCYFWVPPGYRHVNLHFRGRQASESRQLWSSILPGEPSNPPSFKRGYSPTNLEKLHPQPCWQTLQLF